MKGERLYLVCPRNARGWAVLIACAIACLCGNLHAQTSDTPATDRSPVTVQKAMPSPSSHGLSPLALAVDDDSLWVAHYQANRVDKFRRHDGVFEMSIPVGRKPIALCLYGDFLWVANAGDGTVTKIERMSGKVEGTYPVGLIPVDILAKNHTLWIANSGDGQVVKLHPRDGSVLQRIVVRGSPTSLCDDGKLIWVANSGARAITAIDPARHTDIRVFDLAKNTDRIACDGKHIWALSFLGEIFKIHAASGQIVANHHTQKFPRDIYFDGKNVWYTESTAGQVVLLQRRSALPMDRHRVGRTPVRLFFKGTLWVLNYEDETVTNLDPRSGKILGTIQLNRPVKQIQTTP